MHRVMRRNAEVEIMAMLKSSLKKEEYKRSMLSMLERKNYPVELLYEQIGFSILENKE